MHMMMKSWLKYFLIAGLFALCSNLLYLALPIYMMVLYDRVLFSFSVATLITMIVGVLFCLLIMGLLDYFRLRLLSQVGNRIAQKITAYAIESLHKAVGINRNGYNRSLEDLERVRNAIVGGQIVFLLDLPWILIFLIMLFLINPMIGGVATAAVVMAALFQVLLGILENKRYTIADVAFHANTDFAKQCLHHAELVAGMGMLPRIQERYAERDGKILRLRAEADAFHAGIGTAIRFLHLFALAAVFAAGVYVYFSEQISTGSIFALVMITARIFFPFERCLNEMKPAIEAMAAYKRLQHFVQLQDQAPKITLPEPQGKFSAETVSLALAGKTIVHNVSFTLEPGESLGILGPSSAGKTSLCKVLLGIWPSTVGKVRLDGAEISHWPQEQLRTFVGYMPQESELFPVSIAENIARLMTVDAEQVILAAQKAGVHEMILQLPQGYDTVIDQSGKNLAAGQRQLISLARTLYGSPKLVVLDEPQTHIDELGFRMLLHTLNTLKQEKITSIFVTDRSNLLVQLDKLLVMNEGQPALYGAGKDVLAELSKRQQSQQAAGA
ncbi:MAG: type I secretion system permease/ATPase [Desulfobulbus sp.]